MGQNICCPIGSSICCCHPSEIKILFSPGEWREPRCGDADKWLCTKGRKEFICKEPKADLLLWNKPNGGVRLLLLPLGRRWTLYSFAANEHLMPYEGLQQQPSGSQKRRQHSLPQVQCSRRRNGCQSVSMNSRHKKCAEGYCTGKANLLPLFNPTHATDKGKNQIILPNETPNINCNSQSNPNEGQEHRKKWK